MAKLARGPEMYDAILKDRLILGKPQETIATELGISPQTVARVEKVFTAMRNGDYDKIAKAVEKSDCGWDYVEYSAERCGIPVPEIIWTAKNRKDAKAKEPDRPPEKKENPNDALYFCKILEALNKQNELLTQLCDIVIPKWTQDLKDNQNVNADVIVERMKAIEDKLESIKINTRKKGL